MKIYHDIEFQFESWKKRKLTLFGKVTVVNSLALPKLIYISSILELPERNYVNDINRLIYNFIWNKTDRMKLNTMIGDIMDGGIGITDIDSKLKAIKATWIARLLTTNHVVKNIQIVSVKRSISI